MSRWEKHALQMAAFFGMTAYPATMIAFHNNLINFGRKAINYNVPEETMELIEDELDSFKNLLMKVDTNIAVTDSLNPKWRGGFYFKNGFELLLPIRAVAKDISDLPYLSPKIIVETQGVFSRNGVHITGLSFYSKVKCLNIKTDVGRQIFDGFILSQAARRFLVRRELLRANSRYFVIVPISMWILVSSVVILTFKSLMIHGRLLAYFSLAILVPLAAIIFRNLMKSFLSYSEMMLDHDACTTSPEYEEGALQYLKSSILTNLKIRRALGDSKSEFIAVNGDLISDPWPYSKRLAAVEKFAKKKF